MFLFIIKLSVDYILDDELKLKRGSYDSSKFLTFI